jgi:hypothetical protein
MHVRSVKSAAKTYYISSWQRSTFLTEALAFVLRPLQPRLQRAATGNPLRRVGLPFGHASCRRAASSPYYTTSVACDRKGFLAKPSTAARY